MKREQRALAKDLNEDLPAIGSERGSERELVLPPDRGDEQQVRYVRADDQKQNADRTEGEQQR